MPWQVWNAPAPASVAAARLHTVPSDRVRIAV